MKRRSDMSYLSSILAGMIALSEVFFVTSQSSHLIKSDSSSVISA